MYHFILMLQESAGTGAKSKKEGENERENEEKTDRDADFHCDYRCLLVVSFQTPGTIADRETYQCGTYATIWSLLPPVIAIGLALLHLQPINKNNTEKRH